MAVETNRLTLDFVVRDYLSKHSQIEIAPESDTATKPHYAEWVEGKACTLRWYLSLQGECNPLSVASAPVPAGQVDNLPEQVICRYDWAFGITLLQGYYWDWLAELPETGSVAVHVAVMPRPPAGGPEPLPTGAVLSTLHPSRNTRSIWEQALPLVPKAAAEMAKAGAPGLPFLNSLSSGLMAGSDLLASYTDNKKNWFLYQFLDEELKCPVVEWRINKKVLIEYGPLIRGSLYLAFSKYLEHRSGSVRILLRPQIRFDPRDELNYIVPTRDRDPDRQVFLEVRLS